jgi:2-polyprenyl-6-methoxyphenol hydroxylase-like FAD-dependent oxidoreductase
MTNVRHALVIGGGVAGPVAAIALRKAGVDATVFEAYDGFADGVGGGMGIAANGQNALGVLGMAHVVSDIGTPAPKMALLSWTGKTLGEFEGPPGVAVTQFVSRAELYRGIYDEAPARGVRFEHGKRLVSVQDGPDGIVARFADGSTAEGDVLVGADGIHSTVRGLIDESAPGPTYVGINSAGGWTGPTGLPSTHGVMTLVFGKKAFFGYLVTDDGRAGWWISVPGKRPLTIAEMKQTPAEEWLRRFRELVAEDRSPAVEILNSVTEGDLVFTGGSEYMPNVPHWHRGRMILIGDSAHAPSSSSGQGASLAIEDAVQLARCLRDLPTVEDAFTTFEGLRRPRVRRIIEATERTNGNKAATGFGRILRDLLMPVAMKLFAKPEKMAWQFDYPIDWDAPVTSEQLATAA